MTARRVWIIFCSVGWLSGAVVEIGAALNFWQMTTAHWLNVVAFLGATAGTIAELDEE